MSAKEFFESRNCRRLDISVGLLLLVGLEGLAPETSWVLLPQFCWVFIDGTLFHTGKNKNRIEK